MGARVMNSDYESGELHSLDESSFDSAHDDDDHRTAVEIDNFVRKNHPSVLIRDLFWKAVKATYQQEHERAMNELKEVDKDAYKWLQAQSTTIWAMQMFSGDGQSDTVLNNMCESFNSRIFKFRSKPIINMI